VGRPTAFKQLLTKEISDYESLSQHQFCPTKGEIQTWFDNINTHVFHGRIYATFGRVEIRRRHGVWAEYSGWIDPRRNAKSRCKILQELPAFRKRPRILERKVTICGLLSITDNFPSKKIFIEVLAHEMVHLYQFLYATPPFSYRSVSHGKTFHAWKPTFEKHGLRLRVTLHHSKQKATKKKVT